MTESRPSIQVQAEARERTVRLHQSDNVVIAVDPLAKGTSVGLLVTTEEIPAGHKVASNPIASGERIVKFGQIIGAATEPIGEGAWVHSHNVAMAPDERVHSIGSDAGVAHRVAEGPSTFMGIRRADGRIGTRNYVGILTSVNCSASVARFIADECSRNGMLDDYRNVDGVVAFVHGTGCGMADMGEGFEVLNRTQWGYATNPNMAAVLVVGLGCEVFQIEAMKKRYGLADGPTFRSMTIQDTGGTKGAVEAGVAEVASLLAAANDVVREPVPVAGITVALQCGGSDGYSGITANPSLGAAVDLLVAHGGTAILSETPEIYGAEHLLTRRAVSAAVGEKLLARLRWWELYCERNGGEMDNNPTPGNKAGGLTTILEKSLGAAAKGGTTDLMAVYEYAESVTESGFVFMDTPGYDPVSITGQVAGGANLVCFTTGRGSAYGCKPAPSIKLATNSAMYRRMIGDMDLDCGDVIDGVSIESKGREIFDLMIAVASGSNSKSELLGYGDQEFVPWQIGATM